MPCFVTRISRFTLNTLALGHQTTDLLYYNFLDCVCFSPAHIMQVLTVWPGVQARRAGRDSLYQTNPTHILCMGFRKCRFSIKIRNQFLVKSFSKRQGTLARVNSPLLMLQIFPAHLHSWDGEHLNAEWGTDLDAVWGLLSWAAVILWSDLSLQTLNQQVRAWSFTVTHWDVSRNDFPVAF